MSKVRSDKEAAITQEMLTKLFSYDPLTGDVTKLIGPGRGTILRSKGRHGYAHTKIGKRKFQLHRVIWMLVHGEWPPSLVDHKDGNTANNSIENLRLATPGQNVANMRLCRRNSTGIKGVVATPGGKFKAFLHHNRKQKYLGTFDTKELAATAYAEAAKAAFGDFARLS